MHTQHWCEEKGENHRKGTVSAYTHSLEPLRMKIFELIRISILQQRAHGGLHSPVEVIRTLWLFVESDFATFAIPDTLFGVFGALSGSLLTTNRFPTISGVLCRGLVALLYNFSNLLTFDLANQGQPDAALKDSINKPWRPIPTGRISVAQTRRLLLWTLPVVLGVNFLLGCWQETALLFTLTWMYNYLGGGEDGFVSRNIIIGAAYGLYNAGSLRITAGLDHTITSYGYKWIILISSVILTTMHVQDLKDQVGDAAKGRRTCPLVLGDWAARWTIAVPVALWSVVCPRFLAVSLYGYLVPCGVGALIVLRILVFNDKAHDRKTWQLWTAWTALLYLLPVIAQSSQTMA